MVGWERASGWLVMKVVCCVRESAVTVWCYVSVRLLTEHVHKQDTAGNADQGALPPGSQLTHSPPCLTNLHQFPPPHTPTTDVLTQCKY